MQEANRQELYHGFIEFISNDIQQERYSMNRRMFNVFFWCFLLPIFISVLVLLLVRVNFLPRSARLHLDWIILIFPLFYSIYVLGSEVLMRIPMMFRRGGIVTSLVSSLKEGEWRRRVCSEMKRKVVASHDDWAWIIANYKIDLETMKYRNRYLTAFAGAVFYLLMQGIDSIADVGEKVMWVKTALGWIQAPSLDYSQFVGLGLFLVLLYLSGNQTCHSLQRYLDCAELNFKDNFKQNLK